MGLINFYRVFVKTYKEYYKDKIAAKKCIKNTEEEIILLKKKCENARLALKSLEEVYLMPPYEKRTKCVQQTMDMFKYGTGCRWNDSVIKYLDELLRKIRFSLIEMKSLYNDGEYEAVPEYYKAAVVDYITQYRIDYLIDKDYSKEDKG